MTWNRVTWDREAWRRFAACRDADVTVFFPVGSTGQAVGQIASAKRICATCPVAEECLVFAVTTNQEFGVWGGLDEDERRQVRRTWRRASRRVAAERLAG